MKLIKNYLYNLSILLLQIGTPLITIPYVSRIFVPGLVGEGVFAASIAKWLVVFAQLGITTYGIRVISTSKKNQQVKRFWQLFSLNFMMTFVMSLVYSIGVMIWAKDPLLFWIQGLLLF